MLYSGNLQTKLGSFGELEKSTKSAVLFLMEVEGCPLCLSVVHVSITFYTADNDEEIFNSDCYLKLLVQSIKLRCKCDKEGRMYTLGGNQTQDLCITIHCPMPTIQRLH